MKKAILIHGWEGSPEEGWRPWLRSELEKRGFEVIVPAMPNSAKPNMSKWVNHLEKLIGNPDENCYLVGHSLGCITILRYLQSLNASQKIGGAVLVAGFTSNLGYNELDTFFQTKIDWDKIKSHCKKFIAIHSSNDPYVSLHYADFFSNNLNAEIIVEQNMNHFSGDDGINELPSALKAVLKLQGENKI
jgi:predicted alpha/beta hydrolase family esterase